MELNTCLHSLLYFLWTMVTMMMTIGAQQLSGGGGSWEILLENAGIASMHTAVTRFGNVVLLDRTNIGASLLPLPNGTCRDNPADQRLTHDCTAHSAIFDPVAKSIRPLFIFTDTWCSSGQFSSNGTLIQTGGDNDGLNKIRYFTPCASSEGAACDWVEESNVNASLQDGRWYASNQLLPDGRQIVIGGRGSVTLEFIPNFDDLRKPTYLDLLPRSGDAQGDNLYPFLHLLPDGNLFIFVNRFSILYDYSKNNVIRRYPNITGYPRNYPSAGSSVMLPLKAADGFGWAEILICGGAAPNATFNVSAFYPTAYDCGRINASSDDPQWAMEYMPIRRGMGDMVLLPTRQVLIINGVQNGVQGWDSAINPALNPVLYDPQAIAPLRFTVLSPTTIARMYHSTANLLPDGRVLIAGSNPHELYTFTGDFPTELRVEAFSPPYLSSVNDALRPSIVTSPSLLRYGQQFNISVTVQWSVSSSANMEVILVSSPFTTHSFSQGQRLLQLQVWNQRETIRLIEKKTENSTNPCTSFSGTTALSFGYDLTVMAPPSTVIAPSSYYMMFVVNQGIPSSASWVLVSS